MQKLCALCFHYFPSMASKSIFVSVILVVVVCFLLVREPSDCSAAYKHLGVKAGGLMVTRSRKLVQVVHALKDEKTTFKARLEGSSLRKVPSGPDPLHHNGGTPNKPRTP